MKYYEAIINLSLENMEKFLDQVFLTGFNSGHQSLVDIEIDDENPFNSAWLNVEVDCSPALVEDEAGESLIIEQLAALIIRMAEFKEESMPDSLAWEPTIVMPKGLGDDEDGG